MKSHHSNTAKTHNSYCLWISPLLLRRVTRSRTRPRRNFHQFPVTLQTGWLLFQCLKIAFNHTMLLSLIIKQHLQFCVSTPRFSSIECSCMTCLCSRFLKKVIELCRELGLSRNNRICFRRVFTPLLDCCCSRQKFRKMVARWFLSAIALLTLAEAQTCVQYYTTINGTFTDVSALHHAAVWPVFVNFAMLCSRARLLAARTRTMKFYFGWSTCAHWVWSIFALFSRVFKPVPHCFVAVFS